MPGVFVNRKIVNKKHKNVYVKGLSRNKVHLFKLNSEAQGQRIVLFDLDRNMP